MTDIACPVRQRARGVLHVAASGGGGRTRLADLRQQGCLRACFPRPAGQALEAVILNTSGGVTDGDVLRAWLTAGAGASLLVATAAAERIYRARHQADPARVELRVAVADHGRVEYLPQETILFNACALSRSLRIDIGESGVYLGVETLVFGRSASGEQLNDARLSDTVALYRAGRLVLHDRVLLRGRVSQVLGGPATAAAAGAVASLVYAAPDAAARLDPLREALAASEAKTGAKTDARTGASFRDGVLVARIVARDAAQARQAVIAGLAVLRDKNPLPRVWSC